MHEIEVKVLDIDRASVECRLTEIGAERRSDQSLIALFLDFPDRELAAAGSLLRLRKEGDRSILTFKRRVGEEGAKVREETEVTVGDFEACRRLLSALGLVETAHVDKLRIVYRLGTASVVIDRHLGELSFIPELLEIEAGSAEEIRSVAARLGFSPDQLRPWGLAELIDHYRRRD
jgi:predicted adenylyl cyclase CyaB